MKLLLTLLLIQILSSATFCVAGETWIITKEGGAYRVNGHKLMANGRLADANGVTVKFLSKQELGEIGAAIDRYEPPAESAAVQYYKQRERQPATTVKAPEQPQKRPEVRPPVESTSATGTQSNQADSKESNGWLWIIGFIFICALVFGLLPKQCRQCGSFAGQLVESVLLNEHLAVSREGFVNRQRHLNGYRCSKCGYEWLDNSTTDTKN